MKDKKKIEVEIKKIEKKLSALKEKKRRAELIGFKIKNDNR